jgi:hypothetical protein
MDRHSGAGCQKITGKSKDHHDRFFLFRQFRVEGNNSLLYSGIFIFIPVDGY